MSDSQWSCLGTEDPDPVPGTTHSFPGPAQCPPANPSWPPATAWHPPPAHAPRQRNGWLIACMVTIAVVISLGFIAPFAFGAYLTSQVQDNIEAMTGGNTDDILGNNLEVTIGNYTPRRDGYTTGGKLDVTFKNKGAERATFDVTIEAVDDQGRRIEEITAYADDLASGQSFTKSVSVWPQDTQAAQQLLHAKFQILSVSMR